MFGNTKNLEVKIENLERKVERLLWINQDILGVIVRQDRTKNSNPIYPEASKPKSNRDIRGLKQEIEKLPLTEKEIEFMEFISKFRTLSQMQRKFKFTRTTCLTYIRNIRYRGIKIDRKWVKSDRCFSFKVA